MRHYSRGIAFVLSIIMVLSVVFDSTVFSIAAESDAEFYGGTESISASYSKSSETDDPEDADTDSSEDSGKDDNSEQAGDAASGKDPSDGDGLKEGDDPEKGNEDEGEPSDADDAETKDDESGITGSDASEDEETDPSEDILPEELEGELEGEELELESELTDAVDISEEADAEAKSRILSAIASGDKNVDLEDLKIPYSIDVCSYFSAYFDELRLDGRIELSGSCGTSSYRDPVDNNSYLDTLNIAYSPEFLFPNGSVNLDLVKMQKEIYKIKYREALAGISDGMSDMDKILYIHNWIIKNCDYGDVTREHDGDISGSTWMIKGMLVDGKVRCHGYAETFKMFMDELGIECEIVSSDPMNHAWNAVRQNGHWYMVDTTWDDEKYGAVRYSYFMKSDEEYLAGTNNGSDHHDWAEDAPECDDSGSYDGYLFRNYGDTIILYDYLNFGNNMEYYNGYWYFCDGNTIKRAKIDGSGLRTLYTADSDSTRLFSFFMNRGYGYFCDQEKVYRAPMSDFASGSASPEVFLEAGEDFPGGKCSVFEVYRDVLTLYDRLSRPSVISDSVKLEKPVSFAAGKVALAVGGSRQLSVLDEEGEPVSGVHFRSSDRAVATVSADGTVTAKKSGNAHILAYNDGTDYDICDISVGIAAGDLDGDGDLTENDLRLMRCYLCGYSDTYYSADADVYPVDDSTDVNGDGKSDTADYVELAKLVLAETGEAADGAEIPAENHIRLTLTDDQEGDPAAPGATIKVKLSLEDNDGIYGFAGRIKFDISKLQLRDNPAYSETFMGGARYFPDRKYLVPIHMQYWPINSVITNNGRNQYPYFLAGGAQQYSEDGTALTLTFDVAGGIDSITDTDITLEDVQIYDGEKMIPDNGTGRLTVRIDPAAHIHTYTRKLTTETYLKTAANYESPAVYYYACAYCDRASDTLTYTSGEKLYRCDAEASFENGILTITGSGEIRSSAYEELGLSEYESTAKKIVFDDRFTRIAFPFENYTALEELTLGSSFSGFIGSEWTKLSELEKLNFIRVSTANGTYASDDGVVYSKNYKSLICFPKSSHAVYNSAYKSIRDMATWVSAQAIAVAPIRSRVYTGEPITPAVSFQFAAYIDNPDTIFPDLENSYYVEYENNTDPGMASVTIHFFRQLKGTMTAQFRIFDGEELTAVDGVYQVSSRDALMLAQDMACLSEEPSVTIRLENDIDLGSDDVYFSPEGDADAPQVILDLNDHSLTGSGTYLLYARDDIDVVVQNGSLGSSSNEYVLYAYGASVLLKNVLIAQDWKKKAVYAGNAAQVVFDEGTAIQGKMEADAAEITLKKCRAWSGGGIGLNATNGSTVNVQGGTIISGKGTFASNADYAAICVNESTLNVESGFLQGVNFGVHAIGNNTIHISGGNILADGYYIGGSYNCSVGLLLERISGEISLSGGLIRGNDGCADYSMGTQYINFGILSCDGISYGTIAESADENARLDRFIAPGCSYSLPLNEDDPYSLKGTVTIGPSGREVSVEHYVEKMTGGYSETPDYTETRYVTLDPEMDYDNLIRAEYVMDIRYSTFDASPNPFKNDVTHFDHGTNDGDHTVRMYYARNTYQIELDMDEGVTAVTIQGRRVENPGAGETAKLTIRGIRKEESAFQKVNGTLIAADVEYDEEYVLKSFALFDGTGHEVPEYIYTGVAAPVVQGICDQKLVIRTKQAEKTILSIRDFDFGIDGQNESGETKTVKVEKGVIPASIAPSNRVGYTFMGIFGAADGKGTKYFDAYGKGCANVGQADELTLYTYWRPNTYTIKFSANAESDVSGQMMVQTMTYGQAQALSRNAFTRIGYSFIGWSTSAEGPVQYTNGQIVNSLLTGDSLHRSMTLYAVWEPTVYHIRYYLNGGEGNTENAETTEFVRSDRVEIFSPDPVDGAAFAGWYLDEKLTEALPPVDSDEDGRVDTWLLLPGTYRADVDLYAKWIVVKCSITFNASYPEDALNISGSTAAMTVNYGERAALTANGFKCSNYVFAGWELTEEEALRRTALGLPGTYADRADCAFTENTQLYAVWKNVFCITFHTNGGTLSGEALEYDPGEPDTYRLEYVYKADDIVPEKPVRTGYAFGGWYTDNNTFKKPISKIVKGTAVDYELYAKWVSNSYTVKFNKNAPQDPLASIKKLTVSGKMSDQKLSYGTLKALTANKYTVNGYRFVGWNTQANGGGISYPDGYSASPIAGTVNKETITLYAQWEESPYRLTLNLMGGEMTSEPEDELTDMLTYDEADGSYSMNYSYSENAVTAVPVHCWEKKADYDERIRFTFGGWYTDAQCTKALKNNAIAVKTSGNSTLYAKWNMDYTVVFHDTMQGTPGFSGSMAEQTMKYGTATALKALGYKNTAGYAFMGWSLEDPAEMEEEEIAALTGLIADKGKITSPEVSYNADWMDGTGRNELHLYANWRNTFHIHYHIDSDAEETLPEGVSAESSYQYNAKKTTALAVPKKTEEGIAGVHSFAGWYVGTADSCNYKTKLSVIPKGAKADYELYPKWNTNYTAVFYQEDEIAATADPKMKKQQTGMVSTTSKALTANSFSKPGYAFMGWAVEAGSDAVVYKDKQKVTVTDLDALTWNSEASRLELKLYAVWKNEFAIHYHVNGGTLAVQDTVYPYNKTATQQLGPKPVREGYTFGGWYSDTKFKKGVSAIAKGSAADLDLYAKWTVNTYTIQFVSNAPADPCNASKKLPVSGKMSKQTAKYDVSAALNKNGFAVNGWTFAGWNTKADGSGIMAAPAGEDGTTDLYADRAVIEKLAGAEKNKDSVTLYAIWRESPYIVTFVTGGGSMASEYYREESNSYAMTYRYTEYASASLPTPERIGYRFGGWYKDAKYKTKVTSIAKKTKGNMTLYAKWTEIK